MSNEEHQAREDVKAELYPCEKKNKLAKEKVKDKFHDTSLQNIACAVREVEQSDARVESYKWRAAIRTAAECIAIN